MKTNIFISALCATVLTLSPVAKTMPTTLNDLPTDCLAEISSYLDSPRDLLNLMQTNKAAYEGVKQFAQSKFYINNSELLSMQLFLKAFISVTLDSKVKLPENLAQVCQELNIKNTEPFSNDDIVKVLDYLVATFFARTYTKFNNKAYKKLIQLEIMIINTLKLPKKGAEFEKLLNLIIQKDHYQKPFKLLCLPLFFSKNNKKKMLIKTFRKSEKMNQWLKKDQPFEIDTMYKKILDNIDDNKFACIVSLILKIRNYMDLKNLYLWTAIQSRPNLTAKHIALSFSPLEAQQNIINKLELDPTLGFTEKRKGNINKSNKILLEQIIIPLLKHNKKQAENILNTIHHVACQHNNEFVLKLIQPHLKIKRKSCVIL